MAKEEVFSFLSSNGKTKIHAVKWLPEDGKYHTILQITHGMIEYIERYRGFAEYLTERGFMVVGHDHLGHGESVTSEEEWGFIALLDPSGTKVADMHTLRTTIQKENPGVPYFMLGHSMGSYMLRKYLTIHNENLAGAILMGTGFMSTRLMGFGMFLCKGLAALRGWNYRSKFIQYLSFRGPYQKFDVTGKDAANSWLTKDAACVEEYYNTPKCSYMFTLNAYYGLMDAVKYDCQLKNAKKIPVMLPLFIVSGQDDPVGSMGKGVKKTFDMYKKAGIEDITCKLYENDRHEILNETDKEQVYSDIYVWMSERNHK